MVEEITATEEPLAAEAFDAKATGAATSEDDTPLPCELAHQLFTNDPLRPRWADFEDPEARTCAHIIDLLGACGHYIHVNGGGRSGRKPLLCTLLAHGGQMSQRDLMCKFDLKAGSLSEVLTKLEKAGLIERTRDEADRRQLNVSLTDTGKAEAEAEQLHRQKFHQEAFACLTKDERTQLEEVLNRVINHWRTLDD